MSSCLRCFLPASPHCFKRTHFHEASIKTTRDQFGLSLIAEETLDSYWHFTPVTKGKGKLLSHYPNPAGSHSRSKPQSAALSTSRYQLLRHLEISTSFTHRKASQRVTFGEFGEERFHVPVLVSKPDFQKLDEPAGWAHAGYVQLTCALQAESPGTAGTCPRSALPASLQTGASLPAAHSTTPCAHWHGPSALIQGWREAGNGPGRALGFTLWPQLSALPQTEAADWETPTAQTRWKSFHSRTSSPLTAIINSPTNEPPGGQPQPACWY